MDKVKAFLKFVVRKLADVIQKDPYQSAKVMLIVLAVILFLFVAGKAHAEKLGPQQCKILSEFAMGVAHTRDVGADVEKHVKAVTKVNEAQGAGVVKILVETVRKVYKSKMTPDEIQVVVYVECMAGMEVGTGV